MTVEERAEEYANKKCGEIQDSEWLFCVTDYIAGYKQALTEIIAWCELPEVPEEK